MEIYNHRIVITYDELVGGENLIVSIANYKAMKRRKQLQVLRPGKGANSCALIDYDTLPPHIKEAYVEIYGNDTYEDLKRMQVETVIVLDSEARVYFEAFRTADNKALPVEAQVEYTTNASVLNSLIEEINQRKSLRMAMGASTSGLYDTLVGSLERYRRVYGHTLPNSLSRLKDKIRDYKKNGYACLVSGKYGNINTMKITDEAGRFLIALKRSRVPVYTNEQIWQQYNRQAPELGFKQLKSLAAVTSFLNRSDVKPLWYDATQGELAWKQSYTRKQSTILPTMRDALWYSDGTKLNLYYKDIDKVTGKLTVKTTSVYEVMDAATECLLGYHISDNEDFEAQYNAFRMAIQIAGCRPFEIVNDNQGGHKKIEASGFFKQIARVSRRTSPYNGQSKTIESVFGRFQKQILHKYWYFTGQNIDTITEASDANMEFIADNKEKLPTYKELLQIYKECRNEWNTSAHPQSGIARIEMYKNSKNPKTTPISLVEMIDLFWMTNPKQVTYTSSGIRMVVKGRKYDYEILNQETGFPDTRFVYEHGLINKPLTVMYDPCDLSMVRLYEQTASGLVYIATAQPYIKIHRDIQSQEPGEMSFIHRALNDNKKLRLEHREKVNAIENEWGVNPERFGLNRPKLKGISKKMQEEKPVKPTRQKAETFDIGQYTKKVSNLVADPDKY